MGRDSRIPHQHDPPGIAHPGVPQFFQVLRPKGAFGVQVDVAVLHFPADQGHAAFINFLEVRQEVMVLFEAALHRPQLRMLLAQIVNSPPHILLAIVVNDLLEFHAFLVRWQDHLRFHLKGGLETESLPFAEVDAADDGLADGLQTGVFQG
ncbi:hypothetical protein ES703_120585 [subsurface metagenome]